MNKNRFRVLVSVWSSLFLLSLFIGGLTKSAIPSDVAEAAHAAEHDTTPLVMLLRLPVMIVTIILFAVVMMSLVGMLLLWKPSRYMFIIGAVGGFFMVRLDAILFRTWVVDSARQSTRL